MKVGMIARCEDRGLGNMTREWYRNMEPDRVLLALPHSALTQHRDWYPGAVWMDFEVGDYENDVRKFLDGLDVLYTAETMYDWHIGEWARDAGVRTVCHLMPEYFRADRWLDVDVWWTPTRWRLSHLPESVRVVPVPIPLDRFTRTKFSDTHTPLRWLHPGGAPARSDRNGTVQVLRALKHLTGEHEVCIRSQVDVGGIEHGKNVKVTWAIGSTDDYWSNYEGYDAVILPRKYGGLCLPALEAMGAGCALAMTNCRPQRDEWPIIPIPVEMSLGGNLRVYEHSIPLATAQPREIALVMDECAADPGIVLAARLRSEAFARRHSWAELKPTIVAELERACE